MHDALNLLAVVDDDDRGDLPLLEDVQRFGGERVDA